MRFEHLQTGSSGSGADADGDGAIAGAPADTGESGPKPGSALMRVEAAATPVPAPRVGVAPLAQADSALSPSEGIAEPAAGMDVWGGRSSQTGAEPQAAHVSLAEASAAGQLHFDSTADARSSAESPAARVLQAETSSAAPPNFDSALPRVGGALASSEAISAEPSNPASDSSQASVAVATNPIAPAVFAVSEIIRTAADQAAATWRVASVPAQRRESPVALQAAAPPEAPAAEPAAPIAPPREPSPPEFLEPAPEPAPDRDALWPSARRQIALLARLVSLLVLTVLLGHHYLPNVMGFGSLIDTFLPWTFVPLALMVPASLLSRDKWAVGAVVVASGVWGGDFGPQLLRTGGTGPADLRILSQNVSSPTPELGDVTQLAEQQQADVVVLQGLSARDVQQADQSVPARYPYHLAMYEFVVWSRYPLVHGSQPMDLAAYTADPSQPPPVAGGSSSSSTSGQFGGLLRFTVQLDPKRVATVYAVHLPQPSLSHNGFGVARGGALSQLVAAVKAEKEPNLIVVGDLDVAQTDRGMGTLVNDATGLVSVQAKAGAGFGFTWPSRFPMIRLDDVLTRGLTPVRSVVLPPTGAKQAHRPIVADLRF